MNKNTSCSFRFPTIQIGVKGFTRHKMECLLDIIGTATVLMLFHLRYASLVIGQMESQRAPAMERGTRLRERVGMNL